MIGAMMFNAFLSVLKLFKGSYPFCLGGFKGEIVGKQRVFAGNLYPSFQDYLERSSPFSGLFGER